MVDCISQLTKALQIARSKAETLVHHIPRSVVVVANAYDQAWELQLKAHNIQLLTVSKFKTPNGSDAVELSGDLEVYQENLGFGVYLATDRSLRFIKTVRLPDGEIQINDPQGTGSIWRVTRDNHHAWITKENGLPSIENKSYIQLLRTITGDITMVRPR